MRVWVNNVTVDSADAAGLARFYAALLDREVGWAEGQWVVVGRKVAHEPNLVFQQVADPTPGKARMHLDVHADDAVATIAKAVELGATAGDEVSEHGMTWRVMTDPQGNPFCVSQHVD